MLNRKLLALAGSIAVVGANSMALSPIAGAVAISFPGADVGDVMVAAAVYGLATAAAALALAPAIDWIGQRPALLWSLLVFATGLAVAACAPNLWVFRIAQGVAGLAAGCALPAIYGLSAVVAEKGRESEALGIVLTGWTVSLVAGVGLAAVVADFAHWRLVFVGLAAGALALATLIGRRELWQGEAPPSRQTSPLTALRAPGMGVALLTVAAYMTAFYGLYSYLGAHLGERLHLSTSLAGLAPMAYGAGFGLAAFADRLLDRYGAGLAGPLVFLSLILVYAGLAATSAYAWPLIAVCFAWGLANHVGLNILIGRLTALDQTQRGAILGLYSAVTYFSVTIGAFVYRPLYDLFGFAGCALTSAACIALALVLSLISVRDAAAPVPAVTENP